MVKFFVENNAQANAFKMAFMGSTYYNNNPRKKAKYEKLMADISNVESSDEEGDIDLGEVLDTEELPPLTGV
jgi:hypothetical protein